MITNRKIAEVAEKLNIDPIIIKVVAQVESSGDGFLDTKEPKILFEPHLFWKNLQKKGIDPNKHTKGAEDILYPKWGSKPYGKISVQHLRLKRAIAINREAALESASWGKFQVLGQNWKDLGYTSLQEFVNEAYKDEDAHLDIFIRFIEKNNLTKFLRVLDWASFAKGYNGPGYKLNQYDTKMATLYKKLKEDDE